MMDDTIYTLQIMVMPHSESPVQFRMHPGGYVAITRDPSQGREYRVHGKTREEAIAAVAKQFFDGQPKVREVDLPPQRVEFKIGQTATGLGLKQLPGAIDVEGEVK